jgi:AbrB family looped-hinge helix DNA binding protein
LQHAGDKKMRVTTKGQVTIPQDIREKLGITPATEVDFIEKNDRVYKAGYKILTPNHLS